MITEIDFIKRFLIVSLVLVIDVLQAQTIDLQSKIDSVKSKIEKTSQGERLRWMDSLLRLTEFNTELNYDTIARQTIRYALELDSLNIATYHTNKLISYERHIKGNVRAARELFINHIGKMKGQPLNKNKILFYMAGGETYYFSIENQEALKYYDTALEMALKAEEETLVATIKSEKAWIYIQLGDFENASKLNQEALAHYINQKDTLGILDAQKGLSVLYSQNGFYQEAEQVRISNW